MKGVAVAGGFRISRCLSLHHSHVSSPRSSVCSAASTASPSHGASRQRPGRRHRGANHRALRACRPCRRIDQARRTRAGDGQGGRVEVVTDGRPLRGGRRSRAGRRRYLPVAGARAPHSYRRPLDAPGRPPGPPSARPGARPPQSHAGRAYSASRAIRYSMGRASPPR